MVQVEEVGMNDEYYVRKAEQVLLPFVGKGTGDQLRLLSGAFLIDSGKILLYICAVVPRLGRLPGRIKTDEAVNGQ